MRGRPAVRALGSRTLAIPTSVQRTAQVPSEVSKATIDGSITVIIERNRGRRRTVASDLPAPPDLSRLVRRAVVRSQQVLAPIVGRVAPHRVDVVRAVLGV